MANRVMLIMVMAGLLLLAVGCDREITGDVSLADNSSSNCFDCHSDQDFALVAAASQFENSIHASGNNTNRNRLYSAYYSSCEKCHTSEGFIAAVTGEPATGEHFTSFDCFTCHEPHSQGNLNVRVTEAVELF